MNYKQNYIDFIKSRKNKIRAKNDGNYYELHHIIPRSLGGIDCEENLVLLTAREHFLAHYLLWKFTKTKQMTSAFWFVSHIQKRKISSRQYEKLRLEHIEQLSKKVVCLETGEILTIAKAGIKIATTSKNIIRVCRGKNKTAGGYHWEYFDENKDYTKTKWYGKERIIKNTLIRLEDCKIYNSWSEAQKDNKVASGSISAALRSGGYCNGYHWEHFDKNKDYTKTKWYGKKQNLNSCFKKVVCLETGEIFSSQQEAARETGLKKSGPIKRCIEKPEATFAGYHWEYFDENKDYTKTKWYGKEKKLGRKVVCLETGEIFLSLIEVEKKYKTKACGLVDCLKGRQKTFAGYHWEDYDENKNYKEGVYFGKLKNKAHCKKVICLTNGKIFESVKAAAESIGSDCDSFNAKLSYARRNKKNAKIKNLEWSYYED